MATANQALSVNGQKLSNKNPDLTITLDDHPVVQISSIQEESITYSFLTDVEAEVTYKLNLTFIYKKTHRIVVPMTFVHKPKAVDPEPEITDGTTDMTLYLWDTKPINFKVMAGDTDITFSVTKVTDQTDPNDAIELVKVDDTHWGFQAVKARTDEDLVIDAMVDVYVTYKGTEHVLPMTVDVVVKANTNGTPENRFNVEML